MLVNKLLYLVVNFSIPDSYLNSCMNSRVNSRHGFSGQKTEDVILYPLPEKQLFRAVNICTRSLMDRTEASDAFNAGSIPVECRLERGFM